MMEYKGYFAWVENDDQATLRPAMASQRPSSSPVELRHAFAELTDFRVHSTQFGPDPPIGCRIAMRITTPVPITVHASGTIAIVYRSVVLV